MPSGAGAASNSGSKTLDARKRGRGAEKRKFVFASFAARLTSLNLDVLHQDRSSFTQEDKGGSALHFTAEVERWRELNFSTPFLWFCRQAQPCSSTLPLLLHNKQFIFDALCKALSMPNLADGYKPLLSLCVAMARDLRHEFYALFDAFLEATKSLMSSNDPDVIDALFSTLAFVFKFLVKQIVMNFQHVLNHYAPILTHRRFHLRRFMSEVLGYVLRKAPLHMTNDCIAAVVSILAPQVASQASSITDKIAVIDGAGRLISEACRGSGTHLHSRTLNIITGTALCLSSSSIAAILAGDSGAGAEGCDNWALAASRYNIVKTALLYVADRCRRDTVAPVWDGLMPAILSGISHWKSTLQPTTSPLVSSLTVSSAAVCVVQNLALLSSLVVHRHGTRVLSPQPLNDVFAQLIASPGVGDDVHLHAEIIHAVAALVFSAARCCPAASYSPLLPLLSSGPNPPCPLPRDPLAPWASTVQATWPSNVDLRANAVINMCYEAAIHECWSECALHIIEVLAVLVTKSFSSLPTAPSTSGSKREGDVWSVGYERQFAIMRGVALVMYKASPTSRLKGSAALAQLLKALCAFSCQLITTSSLSESNANLSFVCMRACIKWFRFSPNVFAGLRDYVFTAAFSRKVDDKKTANAVACNAASAAAANLCVSITIASCELSSPSATSLCTALASALLSAPSNPQLIQASAEIAHARAEDSLPPLGCNASYSALAPVLLERISSDNASVRLGALRLMVVMCEHEEKQPANYPTSEMAVAVKSSSRGSNDSKPAKKRKASVTASDSSAIQVESFAKDLPISSETEGPARSSGPSVTVTMLQLLQLAVDVEEAPMNALDRSRVLLLQRLASWLEHAHMTSDLARIAAYIILGVFRTPFAMTWPCAIAAGAALCKRFHSVAWEILWGAVETETLELISSQSNASLSSSSSALQLSSSVNTASSDVSQPALDIEFPVQEEADDGEGIELDLNIDNDTRKKSAKGDKGRVIMFDVIESMLRRVTVKDLAQQTAAVQKEYLSGGTVTRMDGHVSDVRLKGTSGIELICQLVAVFAAAPRCAETHAPAFVKLFVRLCEKLMEPIEFSQASRQVEELLETIGRNNASKLLVAFMTVMGLWSKSSSLRVEDGDLNILKSLTDGVSGSNHTCDLLPLFYRIIMRNKQTLQKSSLKCISIFNIPAISHHLSSISRLIDDETFKNELVVFATELTNGGIAVEHRPHIIPLITRILFARLSDRKGGAGSTKLLAVRRAAALTFMSNFEPEELSTLCNLMLQPFSALLSLGSTPDSASRGITATRALAAVPAGTRIGFLFVLRAVWQHLAVPFGMHNQKVLAVLIGLLEDLGGQGGLVGDDDDDDDAEADVDAQDAVLETIDAPDADHAAGVADASNPRVQKQLRRIAILCAKDAIKYYNKSFFDAPAALPLACRQGSEDEVMKELEESGSNRRICVTMPSDEHVIAFARRLMSVLAPNIRAASTQATQGVAAVLAMLRELALLPYTGFMLLQPLPGADTPVVDHVIAILGTNNVSLAAGKACLEILQFLLQSVYRPALQTSVPVFLNHMLQRYNRRGGIKWQETFADIKARRSAEGVARLEFNVLSEMATFVVEGPQCASLAALLVPYIRRKVRGGLPLTEMNRRSVLLTLSRLLPRVDRPEQYTVDIGRQLLLNGRAETIAACVAAACALGPRFARSSELLCDMNAMNPKRLSEPDWDRKLSAYGRVVGGGGIKGLVETLPWCELFMLACQALRDVRNTDLSCRASAASLLRALCTQAKGQGQEPQIPVDEEEEDEEDEVGGGGDEGDADVDADGSLAVPSTTLGPQLPYTPCTDPNYLETFNGVTTCQGLLLPTLRKSLGVKDDSVRNEIMQMIGHAAHTLPALVGSLHALCNDDPEVDFFANMCHIQVHRRSRAVTRLAAAVRAGKLTGQTIQHYIIPVLWPLLQQQAADKGLSGRMVGGQGIVDAAVDCLGACAGVMGWRAYSGLLSRCLRALDDGSTVEKATIRVIIGVLSAFHFPVKEGVLKPTAALDGDSSVPVPVAADDTDIMRISHVQANAGVEIVGINLEDAVNADEDNQAVPRSDYERSAPAREELHKTLAAAAAATASAAAAVVADDELGVIVHDALVKKLLPSLYRHVIEGSAGWQQAGKTIRDAMKAVDERSSSVQDRTKGVRQGLATSIAQVLKLLPVATLAQQLPRITRIIATSCADKDEDVRTSARKTMASVSVVLGVRFLPYLMGELRSTLVWGYQVHVLGHCLHAMIQAFVSKEESVLSDGSLQYCLPLLMDVYIEEIAGDVAQQKAVAALAAKNKEARTSKACDVMELIGKYCTVADIRQVSLAALAKTARKSVSVRLRVAIEELLRRLVIGLSHSCTVQPKDVLTLAYTLLDEYACILTGKRPSAAGEGGAGLSASAGMDSVALRSIALRQKYDVKSQAQYIPKEWTQTGTAAGGSGTGATHVVSHDGPPGSHPSDFIFAQFAVDCVSSCIKQGMVTVVSPQDAAYVGPFIPVLAHTARCKHVNVVASALKVLSLLAPCPCIQWQQYIRPLVDDVFVHLRKCTDSGAHLSQACFKFMSHLLREKQFIALGDSWNAQGENDGAVGDVSGVPGKEERVGILRGGQLRVLLSFVRADMEDSQKQGAAFTMLKAILSCKMMTSDVYDVMKRVMELLVTCQMDSVRSQCRACALIYLLRYPLGEKRLRAHMVQLAANVDFTFETGRKSVLEMLHSCAKEFADDVLQAYSDTILLALVTRLVNEPARSVKAMVVQLIKQLVVRSSKQQVDGIIQMVQEWAREGQVLRQQAALHLLCIVIDSIGERAMRYGSALLQTIVPVLEANSRRVGGAAVDAAAAENDDDEDEDEGRDDAGRGDRIDLDNAADAEVDGGAAAAAQDTWLQQGIFGEEAHSGPSDHSSNWQVLYFAVFAFEKLESNCPALLRESAAAPLTRLMCGATALLHSHPWVRVAAARAVGTCFANKGPEDFKATSLAAAGVELKDVAKVLSHAMSAPGMEERLGEQLLRNLVWVVRAMLLLDVSLCLPVLGRIARAGRLHFGAVRACALKFFAALAVCGGGEGGGALGPSLLEGASAIVYRSLEIDRERISSSESCCETAEEVMAVLRQVFGDIAAASAYNSQRQQQDIKRMQRRSKAKLQKILDPGAAARGKIKKHLKQQVKGKEHYQSKGKGATQRFHHKSSRAVFSD